MKQHTDIIVLGDAASCRYGDIRFRMTGSKPTCSKARKTLASEQLDFLNRAEVAATSTPAWELERVFNAALYNLDNPGQAARYLKELLVTTMAVVGIVQGVDPRTALKISKDVRVTDELTTLRAENERLTRELTISKATTTNALNRVEILENRIIEMVSEKENQPDVAVQKQVETDAVTAFDLFGAPLVKLFDQVVEALELNKEKPDSDFILGLLQHVNDTMIEVLKPWEDMTNEALSKVRPAEANVMDLLQEASKMARLELRGPGSTVAEIPVLAEAEPAVQAEPTAPATDAVTPESILASAEKS